MTLLEFFTSSRYIGVLEDLLKQRREDYREVLAERNAEIRRLRAELGSRGVTMETTIGPGAALKASALLDPELDGPPDWSHELNQMLKEEEDGIRSGGRVQVNESGSDDGA